ncbi:hypothetical protein [Methanospirillum sp.]
MGIQIDVAQGVRQPDNVPVAAITHRQPACLQEIQQAVACLVVMIVEKKMEYLFLMQSLL